MTPLDSLRDEHALIERVLEAAERYAEELADEATSLGDLAGFASFVTEFAELWHHAKEEEFLLPEMVRQGFPWDEGPVAHARQEHEQEAYLGRTLAQISARVAPEFDLAERRREAIAALRGYVAFQRHHIHEEEAFLYTRAGEVLSEATLEDIERRCRELESHRFGGKGYGEIRQRAEDLISRHAR